jgi:ATP-dependent Clp protease ATP-binding subunit ClpC
VKTIKNLTVCAQEALKLAEDEARRLGHNFVGTEHVLLGLTKLGKGVAANVLQGIGGNYEAVRIEVEKLVGRGREGGSVWTINYTPRVKEILKLAKKETKANYQSVTDTGHILLVILGDGKGICAHILNRLGVKPEPTQKEILNERKVNRETEEEGLQGRIDEDVKSPVLRGLMRLERWLKK